MWWVPTREGITPYVSDDGDLECWIRDDHESADFWRVNRSGWFYLRNKHYAHVLLTDNKRVLMLPKRDGGLLLFSLVRPQALLDALRKSAM